MHPLLLQHQTEIAQACSARGVVRLFAVGSITEERSFDAARSDVDFYVEFGPPLGGSRVEQYFGLLEDLARALGRQVDLIEVGAVRNPYVLASLERSKVPVYAAA